jgi:hypothetical protein
VRHWRWRMQGYYGAAAKPPRVPGELAIEVGGDSRDALEADRLVLERRPDIGEIVGPFEVPE